MRAIPEELFATAPPTVRDGVRLLVAEPNALRHLSFTDLPDALEPGDLLVVNTSDTEPAAVDGLRASGPVVVHVSGPASIAQGRGPGLVGARAAGSESRGPGGAHASGSASPGSGGPGPVGAGGWLVELRTPGGARVSDGRIGESIALPHGARAVLRSGGPRIWRADVRVEGGLKAYLAAVGRPITYSYLRERPTLSEYRTVFARPDGSFGSAEMPSAGRPFTPPVLAALAARGVRTAELILHTGVSSLESGESPLPERYRVPAATARAVTAARAAGRRVVAVGTTVTRALETVAEPDGTVRAGEGVTELVLGPDRPARVVTGLVTGWHEPEASHLLLLRAVAGEELVERAYDAALAERYRWHEFGDSCLLLP